MVHSDCQYYGESVLAFHCYGLEKEIHTVSMSYERQQKAKRREALPFFNFFSTNSSGVRVHSSFQFQFPSKLFPVKSTTQNQNQIPNQKQHPEPELSCMAVHRPSTFSSIERVCKANLPSSLQVSIMNSSGFFFNNFVSSTTKIKFHNFFEII